MKIQSTKNYDLFKRDESNREVSKITALQKSMRHHGFLPAHPLHCVKNGTGYYVKDGQHRLAAAKSLGIAVYYVVCADAQLSIPEINAAQRAWTIRDYINSFAAQGNADYQYLRTFADANSLPLTTCFTLLAGSTPNSGGAHSEVVKRGAFKVVSHDLANKVADIIGSIRPYVLFATNRHLVVAISRCAFLPEFDSDHFIHKVRTHRALLTLEPTADAFLEVVEKIYNHFSKKQIPLKFLADQAAKSRNPATRRKVTARRETHA